MENEGGTYVERGREMEDEGGRRMREEGRKEQGMRG